MKCSVVRKQRSITVQKNPSFEFTVSSASLWNIYESYYNTNIVSSSSDLKVESARIAPLFTHKSCFLSACCFIIFAFCLDCIFPPALYSVCILIPFSRSLINLLLFTLHLSFNVHGVIFPALILCAMNWSFVFQNLTDCTTAPRHTAVLGGDVKPCHRWCPASGNARPECAVFPAGCRPAGNLSAPSPRHRVRTVWHHRLGGSPTCTAMREC